MRHVRFRQARNLSSARLHIASRARPRSPSACPCRARARPWPAPPPPKCRGSMPIQSGHQLPLVSVAPAMNCSSVSAFASLVQYWYLPASGGLTTPAIWPEPASTKLQRPREMVGDLPHALRRRDMVLAPGLDVGRHLHRPQIDRRAVDRHPARLDQPVLAVELGQIGAVPFGRQIGGVAVPEEQVELRIILAHQIIGGDVAPDQVAAAQQVEGRRHVAAVEIALVGRELADQLHLLVADEQLEVAGSRRNRPGR